jgi:serine/threonine protein kinase
VATNLQTLIPQAAPEAIDLMMKMMEFDPLKRLTATQCLAHEWFNGFSLNQFSSAENRVSKETSNKMQRRDSGVGSKHRLNSRKSLVSGKDRIGKNSFYKSKHGAGFNKDANS